MLSVNLSNVKSKKDIYSAFGIEYQSGKIYHSEFGFIPTLLVDGNQKLGKGVWTFSTLPTNKEYTSVINGKVYTEKGTCPCHCVGCYATTGNYRFSSTIKALMVRTWLARHDPEFVKRAIMAQIIADHVKLLRIHAAGDFFSADYTAMWAEIVEFAHDTVFWTYTKNASAESAFDSFSNANIVKSCIPGIGFNFGHCDYIIKAYKALKAAGNNVYICRCGIDNNQHCTTCHGCAESEFVLFVEHSTGYDASADPAYSELVGLINSQPRKEF